LRPPWVNSSQRGALAVRRHLLGVDRDHDALRAEFLGALGNERAAQDRGGVDRNLVGARRQQPSDIVGCPDAAADGQRHKTARGRAFDDVENRLAVLVACGDVEEAQFVGASRIVGAGGFDRVTGIDQVNEVDALDDAAVLDVETGNDAGLEGHARAFAIS